MDWQCGMEAYYPVNNEKNNALYEKYRVLGGKEQKVMFGGRLGMYRYLDMDKVVKEALQAVERITEK